MSIHEELTEQWDNRWPGEAHERWQQQAAMVQGNTEQWRAVWLDYADQYTGYMGTVPNTDDYQAFETTVQAMDLGIAEAINAGDFTAFTAAIDSESHVAREIVLSHIGRAWHQWPELGQAAFGRLLADSHPNVRAAALEAVWSAGSGNTLQHMGHPEPTLLPHDTEALGAIAHRALRSSALLLGHLPA